jgi:hypothetical protein
MCVSVALSVILSISLAPVDDPEEPPLALLAGQEALEGAPAVPRVDGPGPLPLADLVPDPHEGLLVGLELELGGEQPPLEQGELGGELGLLGLLVGLLGLLLGLLGLLVGEVRGVRGVVLGWGGVGWRGKRGGYLGEAGLVLSGKGFA